MIGSFRARFKARADGSIDFRIADEERALVGNLVEEMRELLMGTAATGEVDASMRRLYPTAYPDDAERDADYQALMRDELLERRLEHLEQVEASLDLDRLEEHQAMAWVTVLNDARLVLGTKLDVSEEEDFSSLDPEDPQHHPRAIYHYLGHLQDEFLQVLTP